MLDAQKVNSLLKIARREHAQVVFVGDQKQLKSIGSGDFFSQIQEHVKSVDITEANRFKTDLQKEVARLANSKQLDKVVDLLDTHKKVIEIDSKSSSKGLSQEQMKEEKKIALAKEASKIVSQNYKEINAYAADNKQVDAINHQVRQEIGFSDKKGMEFENIKPKASMNQLHNKAHAVNYALSDVVQVNRSIKGLKRFAEYEVKEIDAHNNKLTLQANIKDKKSGATKEHTVQIDARELLSASVGEKSKMEVVEGEKVLITRNNKELGVNNGDIGFVKSFNEQKSELTLKINEKEVTINTNEFKNMSYAYATSIHKSQGATVEKAVLVLDSENQQQNAYNLGEVGVTRQKHDLILITDNKEIVKDQLKNEQVKTSTLDHKPLTQPQRL
jgi:ATP-dependent exoDNAse (exonuclease V) alpha subunit